MRQWKPEGYPSMSPYLICPDAPALIAFLLKVFDGVQLRRHDRPDGSVMHAEVRIDDSVVMIGGAQTPAQSEGPYIHIYVPDAQAVFDRAIAAGATEVQAPVRKDAEDDLRGGFADAWGTTWWVATA